MKKVRNPMDSAIQKYVVPLLLDKGFKGSFPHFRRMSKREIHLLTFHFDQRGGGFVVEVAKTYNEPIKTIGGKVIKPDQITAHDINDRTRIHPKGILRKSSTDDWFRYDKKFFFNFRVYKKVAQQVIKNLNLADDIWTVNEVSNKNTEVNIQQPQADLCFSAFNG